LLPPSSDDVQKLTPDQQARYHNIHDQIKTLNEYYCLSEFTYQQILYLAFRGKNINEIADDLKIKPDSVRRGQNALLKAQIVTPEYLNKASRGKGPSKYRTPPSSDDLKKLTQDQNTRYLSIRTHIEILRKSKAIPEAKFQHIYLLTVLGKKTDEIAKELNLSLDTIQKAQRALLKARILTPENYLQAIGAEEQLPRFKGMPPLSPDDIEKLTQDQKERYLSISSKMETLKESVSLAEASFQQVLYYMFTHYERFPTDQETHQMAEDINLSSNTIRKALFALRKAEILPKDLNEKPHPFNVERLPPTPEDLCKLTSDQLERYRSVTTKLDKLREYRMYAEVTFQNILYLTFMGKDRDDIAKEL
jgi:DNA-binding NarL/FixJ family response regulator